MPKKLKTKAKLIDYVVEVEMCIRRIVNIKASRADWARSRAVKRVKGEYPEGHIVDSYPDVMTLHQYRMDNDEDYQYDHTCQNCDNDRIDCTCIDYDVG